MKKAGYLLIIISLFYGCASSKKLLQEGQYDKAIRKSAAALRKKPNDTEQLHILKAAYQRANMFNLEKIGFLQKENLPENSYTIYQLYVALKNRGDIIRSLPDQDRMQFKLVNYDNEIIRYKQSAAKYFYQQGLNDLNQGGRQNARAAFQEFIRVKKIYSNYKNVDHLLNEAHFAGTTNVLFRIRNKSNKILPKEFYFDIQRINLRDLDGQWINFGTIPDSTINYSYYIVLNIYKIKFFPEVVDRKSFTQIKRIQDGMKYVLDARGNVKRDSSGNDIKVPNMVDVAANVTEIIQRKRVSIGGSLDFVDLQNNQVIKSNQISANSNFEHYSEVVSGNKKALSKKYREMMSRRPIRFPPNKYMLLQAAGLLKKQAKKIIYYNSRILSY